MTPVDLSQDTWNKGQAAGEAFYTFNPAASIEEMHKQAVTSYLLLIDNDAYSHGVPDIIMYTIGFTYGYCDLDCRAVIQAGSGQSGK
jgi:hypothetical protein